ncbi:hypothetical protein [Cryobacterium sp. MLB-32]|uniref:hypothetical protein n=1 Tax=Cryobacterium sp. MLB-32 TaxID=1529318 RepID=UPI00068B0991|nr:hypothetical protein [Cryobacterium sp. MLB-32]
MNDFLIPDPDGTGYLSALLRHFADLRDGLHGEVASRFDKEKLFRSAVDLIDDPCRAALHEIDDALLLSTGTIASTGTVPTTDGGLGCTWTLAWPRQVAAGIPPIRIQAFYGRGFHHPHLRGGTVREWPLNVYSAEHASAELPTLRAIIAAELHNLVFMADYRIVPATAAVARGARL